MMSLLPFLPLVILGDPGAVSGTGEKSKRATKKFGAKKSKFFSRPFRLFPGSTNCPWVSEDALLWTQY